MSERLTDDMVAYLSALDAPMQAGTGSAVLAREVQASRKLSSGNRGPLSMLVFEGAVVAIFTAGQHPVADRAAQLLERHGLADVPDTVEGLV